MSVIAPCITVETPEAYKEAIERLQSFAERVHIDISDGEFAPIALVDVNQLWWPREWAIDIHAMVKNPTDYVEKLISLKPNLIIFHAETADNLVAIINQIKQAGIKAGVAVLRPTVPHTIIEAIKVADHAMIFSGDLGHYGGTARLMQLEKARLIRAIKPEIEIGWDGGVSLENAFTLAQGGVDVLNTGGALAKADDPVKTYNALVQEINKQGVI